MIRQVSVFVENKPGKLTEITRILKEERIHIRALSIADTTDFGILRMLVSDPDKALKALRGNGYTVSLTKVLAVGFADVPGSMGKTVKALTASGVSIEYVYAFGLPGDDKAYGVFKTSDRAKALETLQQTDATLLSEDDILEPAV